MTDVPQYEDIECAYKGVQDVLDRIPETIETKTARNLARDRLQVSERYAYEAREKVKPDR